MERDSEMWRVAVRLAEELWVGESLVAGSLAKEWSGLALVGEWWGGVL